MDDEESVLEGITRIDGIESLTIGWEFDPRVERVTLPGSLQSLTFGRWFRQSLENVQFAKLDFWR